MNTFETIILISMASLGFRCITDKGMIFYFLRGWLDRLKDKIKQMKSDIQHYQFFIDDSNEELSHSKLNVNELDKRNELRGEINQIRSELYREENKLKRREPLYNVILYLAKPVILCGTCMSSVHTLIWWPILVGEYTLFTIVTMLSVAFLNTLLYLIIEKLQGK